MWMFSRLQSKARLEFSDNISYQCSKSKQKVIQVSAVEDEHQEQHSRCHMPVGPTIPKIYEYEHGVHSSLQLQEWPENHSGPLDDWFVNPVLN